jgi:hypothetical protein
VIGLIAYAVVAVFYAAFDFLASRGPLYTVNVLGQAVFGSLRSPEELQLPLRLDWNGIFWYNAVHLIVSLGIGQVVLALVDLAERDPGRSGFAFTILVAGFVVTVVGVGVGTAAIRPVLPWWSIVVANAAAVVVSAGYVLSRRPDAWRALTAFARPADQPSAG